MNITDSNLVEIDGKFYKEAQHITTGDCKLFNSGSGPEGWEVAWPVEVHGKCVGVTFRKEADGQHYHKVWSVGQVIQLEVN
jgi:hypothetical protein